MSAHEEWVSLCKPSAAGLCATGVCGVSEEGVGEKIKKDAKRCLQGRNCGYNAQPLQQELQGRGVKNILSFAFGYEIMDSSLAKGWWV